MSKQDTPRIGLLGLGNMGRAMAERLLEQHVAISVWNRSPDRAIGLDDAVVAATPAMLAQMSDILLVIVRDEVALRAVYLGPEGLCTTNLAGKTVVEMTTAQIDVVKEMLGAAAGAGAAIVDAPVSGSVRPARRGELLIMAGGNPLDIERVRPVLARVARRVAHVGQVGAGITMKLVLNLPLATYWQTLGEALGLGLRYGLTLDAMLALIADSKASIGALPDKIALILDQNLPAEFNLSGLSKDLSAMCASAEAVDLSTPACDAVKRSAAAAVEAGWGDRDLAQLARFAALQTDSGEVSR
jgi:3-hydroxyisobutyrate dehydrogenase